MNCQICGSKFDAPPRTSGGSEDIDEILQKALGNARGCPKCNRVAAAPSVFRRIRKGLLAAFLITTGLILPISAYLRSPMRTTLAQQAITRAAGDLRVQKLLGVTLKSGNLISGGIKTDEMGWRDADLLFPLSGTLGGGVLHVVAGRGDGPWVISTLDVWADKDPQPINLLLDKIEISSETDRDVQSQPLVAPELLSVPSTAPKSDGSYPVIRAALGLMPGTATAVSSREYRTSRVSHFLDGAEDSSEVDLRTGVFVLRHTDLMIADSIPLVFTRVFHTVGDPASHIPGNWAFVGGDSHPSFGPGFSHTYDICPMGDHNPGSQMEVVMADGNSLHFVRISKGNGYANAWYEQLDVSSEFYKARLWWNGIGWTLSLEDGTTYLFPESSDGKNLAQGATLEMRDPEGHRVQLARDGRHNLRRLVSPSGRIITLEYDKDGLIQQAHDDAGHHVDYSYDSLSRLTVVHDSLGPIFRYKYDRRSTDKIVIVENGEGRAFLRNTYDPFGRVSEQVFADGSRYGYTYEVNGRGQVTETMVTTPDGKMLTFDFENGELVSKN